MRTGVLPILLVIHCQVMADYPDPRTVPADERIGYLNRVADRAGDANVRGHYQRAAETFRDLYDLVADLPPEADRGDWESVASNLSVLALRADWTAAEEEVLQKWLGANKKTLAALKQAAEGAAYFEPLVSEKNRLHDALPVDSVTNARNFWRLMAIQASEYAREGRWEEAFAWNARMRRLADHACQQPFVIQHMVAMANERNAYDQLLAWLARRIPPRPRKLLETIANEKLVWCPVDLTHFAESLYGLDQLEALYEWAGNPTGHPDVAELVDTAIAMNLGDIGGFQSRRLYKSVSDFQGALRRSSVDHAWKVELQINEIYRAWRAKPFHEAWAQVEQFREAVGEKSEAEPTAALFCSFIDADQYDYLKAVTRAQRSALLTVIAVLDHRASTGRVPRRLGDLRAVAAEIDMTDPFSGRRLCYRGEKNGGFVLYSVGPDCRDDGGKHNDFEKGPGDFVFWPVTLPERWRASDER